MSLHLWNRFSEHADLSQLTPAEIAICKEIAMRTNGTKADLMRLGVRYLAKATGYSELWTSKTITSLIAKGYLAATQASKRTARVFTLLVDCPADCKQAKNHYSAAEKRALAASKQTPEPIAECVTELPLSDELSEAECVTELVTNRELNKELNKDLNTRENEPVTALVSEPLGSVLVSLAQWKKLCLDITNQLPQNDLTAAHKAIAANPGNYHTSALNYLATKENISSPIAYLARVFRDNPQTLLAAEQGTRKDLKALDDFLKRKFASEWEWRDPYTNELKHDYNRVRADLMEQPEASEWLETFSNSGTISARRIDPVIHRLLSGNPEAYERSESQQTA